MIFPGSRRSVEPEIADRPGGPFSIGGVERDPDVHVGSRPDVSVMRDGIAAYDEVLNPFRVQQSQELFEVGR